MTRPLISMSSASAAANAGADASVSISKHKIQRMDNKTECGIVPENSLCCLKRPFL